MTNIKQLIEDGIVIPDKDVIIATTKEYSLFNLLNSNREIKRSNVENIKKSILQNGYSKFSTIIIDEDFNIINGQHRFTACHELDMPIRFTMIEGATAEDMIILNSNQRNWENEDFIKSYAYRGFKYYQTILEAIEKNSDISLSYLLILMFDNRNPKLIKSIQQGTVKVTDEIMDRFYKRVANYRSLILKYSDRFNKKDSDDVKPILDLLDNDFMCSMLEGVFERDKDFKIDLRSREINHMKYIADKIKATF